NRGAKFVLLGSGESGLEDAFRDLAERHPHQVYTHIGFDEGLAHRIEAGVDFFLMPSRFEPCGLNQMYSQRYGTIPIVHEVGGLRNTVEPWHVAQKGFLRGKGTGFGFKHLSVPSLLTTIDSAIRTRMFQPFWKQIRENAMKRDFSWEAVLPEYELLYLNALNRK
ncbi:MAG: hypothetical protein AAF558_10805, partial [Verrucomicrobiota bacterium]